ncbi:MAG TPA: hypothetical protein VER55_04685, partial [Ardenticatenaceae bacterium]|nr:hypothetical protein [Ardenticatenaceae bacterium]
ALALARDLALARTLAHALALARDRNHLPPDADRPTPFRRLRWLIRVWALSILFESSPRPRPRTLTDRLLSKRRSRMDDYDDALMRAMRDLYIDMVILEERIDGNLPAFEGIRIVKERKKED